MTSHPKHLTHVHRHKAPKLTLHWSITDSQQQNIMQVLLQAQALRKAGNTFLPLDLEVFNRSGLSFRLFLNVLPQLGQTAIETQWDLAGLRPLPLGSVVSVIVLPLLTVLGPVVKRLVCWQLTCPWCHCHLSAMYPPGASVSCHCKSARGCAHSIKAESEILITPRQVPRQTTQCLTGQLSGRWCRRLPLDDLIRSNRARLINHWRQGWQA